MSICVFCSKAIKAGAVACSCGELSVKSVRMDAGLEAASETTRKAVAMLKAGKTLIETARACDLSDQTVTKLLLRWLILPDWKRMRANFEDAAKRGNHGNPEATA